MEKEVKELAVKFIRESGKELASSIKQQIEKFQNENGVTFHLEVQQITDDRRGCEVKYINVKHEIQL